MATSQSTGCIPLHIQVNEVAIRNYIQSLDLSQKILKEILFRNSRSLYGIRGIAL